MIHDIELWSLVSAVFTKSELWSLVSVVFTNSRTSKFSLCSVDKDEVENLLIVSLIDNIFEKCFCAK